MDCPECKSKIQIKESYNSIQNDNDPNTPTEAYTNFEMACMNRNCSRCEVVADTIKHKIEFR
jgi:hypothetical protein